MIAIVHYGVGNVQAIANIYKRLDIAATLATTSEDLAAADRIVLPGVGAFDWAMARLNNSGMRGALDARVRDGAPILGICVGMQMLARKSDEGKLDGLGLVGGDVKKFDTGRFSQPTHLPHMGWNNVQPRSGSGLFKGLEADARFYFLHSYYFAPDSDAHVLGTTHYEGDFASSVGSGNVYGVQFHPEKSHRWGIRLLQNFAEI